MNFAMRNFNEQKRTYFNQWLRNDRLSIYIIMMMSVRQENMQANG